MKTWMYSETLTEFCYNVKSIEVKQTAGRQKIYVKNFHKILLLANVMKHK